MPLFSRGWGRIPPDGRIPHNKNQPMVTQFTTSSKTATPSSQPIRFPQKRSPKPTTKWKNFCWIISWVYPANITPLALLAHFKKPLEYTRFDHFFHKWWLLSLNQCSAKLRQLILASWLKYLSDQRKKCIKIGAKLFHSNRHTDIFSHFLHLIKEMFL